MTGPTCLRIGVLLGKRAAGLSESERLRLEEHLVGCGDCSEEAGLLAGLRQLSDQQVEAGLDASTREAVIARALAEAATQPEVPRLRYGTAVLAGGAALSLAAVALVWLAARPQPVLQDGQAQAPRQEARTGDHVLSGELVHAGLSLGEGSALPSSGELSTRGGARVTLAQATVEFRPGSAGRWVPADASLELREGSVDVAVTPQRGRFEVRTSSFAAVVMGTRFEVSLTGVTVHEGKVRVESSDGVLLQELGAGESWARSDGQAASPGEQVQAPEPPQEAKRAPTTRAKTRRVAPRVKPEPEPESPSPPSPTELLARARQQLGAGQPQQSRLSLATALAAELTPVQRAEALSLRAETHLVQGQRGQAVASYLEVADRFAALAAGENALFAAARLEQERGRTAAARKLLERYLARYARGRFQREARTRLQALGPSERP